MQVKSSIPSHISQSVKCLSTDVCLTEDPGVASLITALSHTLVEINHEIDSRPFSYLPLIHSRRAGVSYICKYVHEVLDNHLFKLA